MTEEEKNEQDTETLLKYFGAHLYNYLTLPHQVSASMADMTQKVTPRCGRGPPNQILLRAPKRLGPALDRLRKLERELEEVKQKNERQDHSGLPGSSSSCHRCSATGGTHAQTLGTPVPLEP
ncbi:hypothetical protein AALO_G00036020 [Alosa alosa]|uniref:Uncharacterized protein n=1 Tax=Alosa alosa TaxID=278164 RepID=A0AAV6HA52_9TELE|nr:hypothetical protein AALO_G00036020 [Alosa alosa]